jgi:hypothetical protein
MSGAQSPEPHKLRVGLLLDSLELAAWEARTVEKIVTSAYAELALVIVTAPERRPDAPHRRIVTRAVRALLCRAYAYWEARYPCEPDAFATRDVGDLVRDVPVLRARAEYGGVSPGWSPADLDCIRSARLDVLLTLSKCGDVRELARVARYGVWAFHHGDPTQGFGRPPGFWEIYYGVPRSAAGLHVVDPASGETYVLARTYSSTNPFSSWRNNNARYWKATSLVARKLKQLRDDGELALRPGSEPHAGASNGIACIVKAEPRNRELATFLAGRFMHALRSRAEELLTLPQWILLFRFGQDFLTPIREYTQILPSKDRFWADPHVMHRDGKYYIFIEELMFENNKGHISVLVMDEAGAWQAPVKVLERDYHLSYPSLVEWEGALYMIPESGDNRTVELYRCVDFPTRWEFVRNLLEGVEAYDATVLHHDGRWWLFATVVEERGASSWDELFLFHSDSLLGNEWIPHRLNPIISDAGRARPAGAIIREGERLYRPSQDCSVRYGYAIRLNEITRLSSDEYEEREVVSLSPDGSGGIIGTHTYARAGGLTVIDGLRPRWRT